MKGNKKGFTIVELMVCLAVVAILATASITGYSKFVDKAKGVQGVVDDYNARLTAVIDSVDSETITVLDAEGSIFVSTIDMIPEDIRSDGEATVVVRDNILYVVGSGDMTDYTYSNLPTYRNNDITKIIVQDGIISIGDFAFFQMSGIEEVILPSTVIEIGKYSFYEATGLISINTDDLMKIGNYAFYGCQGLTFTTNAYCEYAALEFLGDDQSAFPKSLEKVKAMKAYLNEVYLNKYTELGFDIDYCSADDIELLQALANKITAGCTTSEQKATAIYNWMISNIKYGSAGSSPIDVYKNREGLCSGQSQLMSTLFKLSGIPSAIIRCSKQGTNNIDLTISNEYVYLKQHEFVMAYVDGDWYGYDSCWKWNKMSEEKVAEQYVILHVDGVMTGLDLWDITTWLTVDTWYINGEFVSRYYGEATNSGGSNLQVGGCLKYNSQYYNTNDAAYYNYTGTGTNKIGHALLGGIYTVNYISQKDNILVKNNGVREISYYEYDGHIYFDGIKVDNVIPDLGLTDNRINLYISETIDLGILYPGCTLTCSNSKLTISGTTFTAVSEGTTQLTIKVNNKSYTLKFYVMSSVLDSEIQELCDHDHIHNNGISDICSYCGKIIK